MFDGKTLLITGGTGSFGNAMLNRFINSHIKEIRIFSRDEKKQNDMRHAFRDPRVTFYIGDVRDYSSINHAMNGVDYVFHAAALKQVPSCEFYPMEAVKTNILGAENVMNAAVVNGVKKLIALSTDKAVYPINAMGISKAMMEKLIVAKSRTLSESDTVLCCTRYGNVMASRGSVIPLFIDQIKGGGPITMTDPMMTRFLMSLDEAVDLVLHAFKYGKQGDIWVHKAPASTIQDLSTALMDIFDTNVDIRVIGTRHGEKLFETLVTREEMVKAEERNKYFRIRADNRDLNYNKYLASGQTKISDLSDFNSHNTKRLAIEEIKQKLIAIEYIKYELSSSSDSGKGYRE
ncbi:MAG: polysaccharide biosynthesis protein [Bacillota bacterium]|nr:polysaccharide biosynthesis protein [Bacillota bacterium]MDD3298969.1 polysaccharide biosynthesis protein [Bacillota bacterium]MDD3851592.1 polysaccharide biosynthesis protein [Bacillota bacterium]MDD4708002.1 polysaccharide biosynthesis protein [Bacillota bacterium]